MEDAELLTPSEWMCLPCSLVRSKVTEVFQLSGGRHIAHL